MLTGIESFIKEKSRKMIIGGFLIVPLLTSLISAIHIFSFFQLGNPTAMAFILALAYELGSLASFMVLTIMDKVKRYIVWTIFFLLAFMQLTGNFYAVFDFISSSIQTNSDWLKSFKELFSYFIEGDDQTFKVLLTTIIAAPISLISLAFLKSLVDYVPSVKESVNVMEDVLVLQKEATEDPSKDLDDSNQQDIAIKAEEESEDAAKEEFERLISIDDKQEPTDSRVAALQNNVL